MNSKSVDKVRDLLIRLDDLLLKVNETSPETRPQCRKGWVLTEKAASLLTRSDNSEIDSETSEVFSEIYPEVLFVTGHEYNGLFFRKSRDGRILAFSSRFSETPICDLDEDVEITVVDLVCAVFEAGRQATDARSSRWGVPAHAGCSHAHSRH